MDEHVNVGWNRLLAAGVPVLIALVWVALTWRSGLTYHFMPLVVAASGADTARWLNGTGLPRAIASRCAVWSLLIVFIA